MQQPVSCAASDDLNMVVVVVMVTELCGGDVLLTWIIKLDSSVNLFLQANALEQIHENLVFADYKITATTKPALLTVIHWMDWRCKPTNFFL